jgi:hypothetical protein
MAHATFEYEYTDTFGGEANYCWVKRGKASVPELTHYGYDGRNGYAKADKAQSRELVRLVKAELGLTGHPCARVDCGHMLELRPRNSATVIFINYCDE